MIKTIQIFFNNPRDMVETGRDVTTTQVSIGNITERDDSEPYEFQTDNIFGQSFDAMAFGWMW